MPNLKIAFFFFFFFFFLWKIGETSKFRYNSSEYQNVTGFFAKESGNSNRFCKFQLHADMFQNGELKCIKTEKRSGGGRKRLPKFKFSAKFPIGLHVILQIQIKKFENYCYLMWKIILTENPSRFNVEPLLK